MTVLESLGLTLTDEGETDQLARLHSILVERASGQKLLDVAYRTLDTPVGNLLLAATSAGLVRVAFESENHEQVLQQLAQRVSPRILFSPERLDVVANQIDEYFGNDRRFFDLQLDFQLVRGFRRDVLDNLRGIQYGATASYSTVAMAVGRPRAVRAVGSACAANPLPVVVPCHRVVRSDGALGGYAGGLEVKRTLLSLEAEASASW